jgi:hypothetical protein
MNSISFLDKETIKAINIFSVLKDMEIEIRFKITQGVYFYILRLLERYKIKNEKKSFTDWIENSEDERKVIRRRLFDDNKEIWTEKQKKFFRRYHNYGFNVSISQEMEISPIFPLRPNLVRNSQRTTFNIFSMKCDLSQVLQRGLDYKNEVFFELELEIDRNLSIKTTNIIKDLERSIYICLKLVQQSFVNPFSDEEIDFWNATYTKSERDEILAKLNELGLDYNFLAKPRDINFADFSQNKLLNPDFGYRITRKVDGERRLLVFFHGVWLVGFSRPRELQLITRNYEETNYEGIVLDGELTESLDTENLYVPFDAICESGFDKSISLQEHNVRLNLCQIVSDYFKNINIKSFSLMTKDFIDFQTAEQFFEVVRKIFAGNAYIKYKTDGLLFVPAKVPYTKQDIIKWKPQKKYTIDLRYKKGFWYSAENQIVDIPVKLQSLKVIDDNVVELRYDPTQKVFIETRIRFDKPFPNKMKVVNHILDLIKRPITEDTLKGKNNMIFLKKFHNRIKQNLINQSVNRLQNYFGNITLLDVGSGQGGDINKWTQIDLVYAVEPDKQRVEEFKRRLGSNKKVKILNEKIENIDFKEEINLVTLFNVLTLLDHEGLNKLITILKRNVLYQGEILFLVFDGNIVNNVFIGNEKDHGVIFKEIAFDDGSKIRYEKNNEKNDGKIFINIPNSLVENQTEFIFYPDIFADMLTPEFTLINYDYAANKEKFLSNKERVFNSFYSFGVFKRMDDDKEEFITFKDGRTVKRIYCLLDEKLPELHPILKAISNEYRSIKSGHYNRYNYGLNFLKKYKDLESIAYNFEIQIEILDETGTILKTINSLKTKKISIMKNMLIEY